MDDDEKKARQEEQSQDEEERVHSTNCRSKVTSEPRPARHRGRVGKPDSGASRAVVMGGGVDEGLWIVRGVTTMREMGRDSFSEAGD